MSQSESNPARERCDRVWTNARLATLNPRLPGLRVVEDAAIGVRAGRIIYVGPTGEAPPCDDVIDCGGRWILPGLIDCHTHLVHAGDRANEFESRLAGQTYEQIARAGGGILSSVRSLRTATEAELVRQSLPRLDALIAEGVTTIEIKSGYGLDLDNERKSLRAARLLGVKRDVDIRTTYLGAHAVPPEFNGDRAAYIDHVIADILPMLAAENLVDAVDGFCEKIAFSADDIRRLFNAAKSLGLPVKLHADQLSNGGGAAIAAELGALSADHLEHADEPGVAAMAAAGTTAVLLPGAFYFLRETKKPPVDLFRNHDVPMAVATDCNPGTSPLTSLLLAMNMAATLFGLTIDECIAGVTREAARALGLLPETGTLEVGKWADLSIWNVERPAELVYRMGSNSLFSRVRRGKREMTNDQDPKPEQWLNDQ